jgi:hypothetical protein
LVCKVLVGTSASVASSVRCLLSVCPSAGLLPGECGVGVVGSLVVGFDPLLHQLVTF